MIDRASAVFLNPSPVALDSLFLLDHRTTGAKMAVLAFKVQTTTGANMETMVFSLFADEIPVR
jgi:hypothetical protein